MINIICSSGQSGVDRAALTAAKELGFPITGWVLNGGWAEDYIFPPGVLSLFPELKETSSEDPRETTVRNIKYSDSVLLIANGQSPDFGIEVALRFHKPSFVVRLSHIEEEKDKLLIWLKEQNGILCIGGSRESESPGIYMRTYKLLKEVLK